MSSSSFVTFTRVVKSQDEITKFIRECAVRCADIGAVPDHVNVRPRGATTVVQFFAEKKI